MLEPSEEVGRKVLLQGPQCPLSTEDVANLILKFAMTIKDPLYTYQQVFARRVIVSVLERDGATVTALWARQVGKTEVIAVMSLAMAIMLPILHKTFPGDSRFVPFNRGLNIGIYAPILSQAQVAFERMRDIVALESFEDILADPDINLYITTNKGDTLKFSNGSVVRARSASPDSKIEGATHHLVLCEESQELLRSKVDKSIRPMLASTRGTMVQIGTANSSCGGFHGEIQLNIEQHKQGGKQNHFEFDYLLVIRERKAAYDQDGRDSHLSYERFINSEILRYGKDSPEFKMNYMCLWQEATTIAVNADKFKAAALLDVEATLYRSTTVRQVAGLDLAKINDSTVLTIGSIDLSKPIIDHNAMYGADGESNVYYNKTIHYWLELQGSFEGDEGQYSKIVDALRQTAVDILVVDGTGLGSPIVERIMGLVGDSILVHPYVMSTPSKSALSTNYLTELHAGRIKYAAGPLTRDTIPYKKFEKQHLDLQKVVKNNVVVCQAPEGEHDDFPLSAMYMAWAEKLLAKENNIPEVEVSSGFINNRSLNASMPTFEATAWNSGTDRSRSNRYRKFQ
jgi:hypothetical protein